MTPVEPWELWAAWLGLAILLAAALPAGGLLLPVLAFLPWLLGAVLLLRRPSREAAASIAARQLRDPGGRITLLITAVLVAVAALAASVFPALLLLAWSAAAGLLLLPLAGQDRFSALWGRMVTVVAAVVVACALLEGALRMPFLRQQYGPPSEVLAWERRYDSVAARNLFGFRTVHQTVSRAPGVLRLLALGDSFTWGDKIASTDSIWPSLLEAELTRSVPESPTEVINVSRRGWSMADEVRMLDRIGWQFQPDRLLVQFYANDTEAPRGDPDALLLHGRPPAVLKGGLLQTSALVSLVRQEFAATLGQAAQRKSLYGGYADGSPGWARVQAGLRTIGDSARARGVPVTLVLFPGFNPGRWTADSHPLRQAYAKVSRAAQAEGIDVLDLTPAYASATGDGDWRQWWATPYDGHPNAQAHLLAARSITRHLVERGWGRGH